MNHLKVIRYLDYLSAAILIVVGVLLFGSTAATVWVVAESSPDAMFMVIPSAGLTAAMVLFMLGMGVVAWRAARRIEDGRGRVAQSILAVVSVINLPVGTIFALYSLWACWVNEDTRSRFDNRNTRRELFMVGLGVLALGGPMVPILGLSLTSLIPFDHEGLDAEWEPLADRSQRVELGGCGLTEVSTPAGCVPARPTEVTTQDVSFPTRGQTTGLTQLNGTVYLPQGLDGPRPAAILVHGSGPSDRRGASPGELVSPMYLTELAIFESLAMELAEQGLVVLSYDKRSCGRCYPEFHGSVDYRTFRFQFLLDDARAGIDWLEAQDHVDGDAVVVLGHSQGGGFAPHIAAADDRVVAAVMLAGFVGTFREALTSQLESTADIRRKQWDYLGAWNVDLQVAGYRACLDKLDAAYDPDDFCIGGGTTLQAIAEYDELNEKTLDVIAGLDKPLCALNGTVDRNVGPEQLMAIREASRGDAEFHLLSGVGHGLRNLVEPSNPPIIDPQVSEVISTFLSSVKAPDP